MFFKNHLIGLSAKFLWFGLILGLFLIVCEIVIKAAKGIKTAMLIINMARCPARTKYIMLKASIAAMIKIDLKLARVSQSFATAQVDNLQVSQLDSTYSTHITAPLKYRITGE